jgi:hypothetical protein
VGRKNPVITVEQNTHQLLKDLESVLRLRGSATTLGITGGQGDEASKGYRKVLFISRWEEHSDRTEWRRNALVGDNMSERIFELLDAENSGQGSKSELRDLLKTVMKNGESLVDPDEWLQNRGHDFNGLSGDLMDYQGSHFEELYPLLFPNPKGNERTGSFRGI